MSKAIQTTWNGVTYRSRLEATWAAFFTNIGWAFQYEPLDGNGYIPDFLIIGDRPTLIEIKPIVTEHQVVQYKKKIERGVEGLEYEILVFGVSPVMHSDRKYVSNGLTYSDAAYGPNTWLCNDWTHCQWAMCDKCKKYTMYMNEGLWEGSPCGHRLRSWDVLPDELVLPAWNEAKHLTRWLPGTKK